MKDPRTRGASEAGEENKATEGGGGRKEERTRTREANEVRLGGRAMDINAIFLGLTFLRTAQEEDKR